MLYNLFKRTFSVFLILIAVLIPAQNNAGVILEIRNESRADKGNIIDLIVVVKNTGNDPFTGKVEITTPSGFRNISPGKTEVHMKPGENLYLPVKILVNNNVVAGESHILCKLTDGQNFVIAKQEIPYVVSENNMMRITPENPVVYMNNVNDSVEVKARVSNLGNKRQNVTLVFKIPEVSQGNIFIEKSGTIEVQKDSIFVFRFFPSKVLMRSSQFTVQIAGFREPDKEIFGNTSVSVQNISSTQRYEDRETDIFSNFSKNSITVSYRRVGENLDMYQMIGSGGFNLPSGYLYIRGNIYAMNNHSDPVVNNTYISYHRENNEFTLGNMSKLLELSLFGRGAEYAFTSSDKDKKIEVGFVDQSFSLIERNSFLKNGYGFYTRGTLGAQNASRSISGTYIFRNDPYDKARHHLAGTDVQYAFNQDWKMNAKMYSGLSFYEDINTTKPSLALESQYSGRIKKVNLNGNYFYSTNYYPGNRRGMLQIQQNFSSHIFTDHYVYANVTVSDFSPKFYFYNTAMQSDNIRVDTGINFPKKGNFALGVGYQYQEEKSNSYNNFFNVPGNQESKQLKAQRLTEYITWLSPDKKHSSIIGIETGLVDYPNADHLDYQMKINGNYNYKWLNVNCTYQYGSYFLSEYAFSKMMNVNTPYEKLSLSAFVNKNLFREKINISSGVSYTHDVLYGRSPSGFVNLKYSKERYGLYLNSSWFNYSSNHFTNNLLTIEAGITINFQTSTLNPGKKGEIKAFVYYDRNNNNVYDGEDQEAKDYLIMLNNISFKTDQEGNIRYQSIPFGKYALKQIIQQGWYYDEASFEVDKHHYFLEIPLHQNGTSKGKVIYQFDAKTALEFSPKIGGIILNIFRNDQFLQKVMTDDNGEFISFLESGNYRIELNGNSLPANTYCERMTADFTVEAGKIVSLEPFIIKVKEKNIRVKKFGN
ncbi:COG1470 family protein [Chryseobacterium proteolyticum]|uniref:COG1470 family protein n=1 Tax=Chryseobacterium proteolyticum TaxID=118127 RepID=UPI0039830FB6